MGNFRKGQFKSNDTCTKTGEIGTRSLKTMYFCTTIINLNLKSEEKKK